MNTYHVEAEFESADGYTRFRARTDFHVVHHAAATYASRAGIDDVREVHRFHRDTRKWPGIGYHEALAEATPGGPIERFILSNPNRQRASVYGLNHRVRSVCCLADFTAIMPPQKWLDALAEVLREWQTEQPTARIVGHGDIALSGHGTTCPGRYWNTTWKPRLITMVTASNFAALWGPDFPYIPDWGIPQEYRRTYAAGIRLGRAISPETRMANGTVWQVFEHGAIEWSEARVKTYH